MKFVCVGRCESKGALTGSNAGITSIDFDSAVRVYSFALLFEWELHLQDVQDGL